MSCRKQGPLCPTGRDGGLELSDIGQASSPSAPTVPPASGSCFPALPFCFAHFTSHPRRQQPWAQVCMGCLCQGPLGAAGSRARPFAAGAHVEEKALGSVRFS